MALTDFQRSICQLVARQRAASGESYVAGGAALNHLLDAPRLSRDVDLFHDTRSAVEASFVSDRNDLERAGYVVSIVRERSAFFEALVSKGSEATLLQWVQDSAYRFFPLVEHPEFGLVLHPLDLATNKVLALIGRVEVRDWVDIIEASERLQPLGCLAWAAVGKDPGFSPAAVLEQAARGARYSNEEVASLAFAGPSPDAADLSRRWHAQLTEARQIVRTLPPEQAGTCLATVEGALLRGSASDIRTALHEGRVRYRKGSIRGALPTIVG